ncbi:MAG TPA: hypothetical protein VFG69_21620 [Nannocystaceae bacterium]|nr:hypothetical protein [Nannocystaceae bacterium]
MDATRHLRLALGLVALVLGSGLVLEGLFGLRTRAWMDDAILREFVRLGHTHGGVLALVNVGLAFAMGRLRTPEVWARRVRVAALAGAVLVALGFVGGGLWHGPSDPGPLVLFVPAGALMLVASVAVVAVVRSAE